MPKEVDKTQKPKRPKQVDKVEKDRRVRLVMEWLLEDWPAGDIIKNIMTQWELSDRQAKRYLADARIEWNKNENAKLEQQRRIKIESLKKLKRSLKDIYKGTPGGIRAALAVEREIIILEGIRPADRLKIGNDEDKPFEIKESSNVDYKKLPNEVLELIVKARKKNEE